MITVFRVFPTLIFPFLLYILFLAGGVGALASGHAPLVHITLISGAVVGVSAADVVALAIVVCLSLDLGSASDTATSSIVHLCVDAVLATIFLVLFLLLPAFGTTIFLILTAAALLEFMIGGWIMVVSARRDVAYASGN